MPTTLTGLLLFVVLLLPGFAYLVGKERAGTERRTSPFRETVAVVSASVTSEVVVAVLAWPFWSRALDIDKLVGDLGAYWEERPGLLATWGLGILAASTAAAYSATLPRVRSPRWPSRLSAKVCKPTWLRRLLGRLPGPYPHPSSVSGWWLLFETWKADRELHVGCVLDDGSHVSGTLESFNASAADSADRDLILFAPIEYRAAGSRKSVILRCGVVCVSASRIRMIQVGYSTTRLDSPRAERARQVPLAEAPLPDHPGWEASGPRSGVHDQGPPLHAALYQPGTAKEDAARTSMTDRSARPSSSASPAPDRAHHRPRRPPIRAGNSPGPYHRPPGVNACAGPG
jgi:hypothetical protein